jgi:hypothetical protein
MSKLPPISAPFSRRWREFRIQYLPFVAFGISVLAAASLWKEFAVPLRCDPPANPANETSITTPASEAIATFTPVISTASITNQPHPFSE